MNKMRNAIMKKKCIVFPVCSKPSHDISISKTGSYRKPECHPFYKTKFIIYEFLRLVSPKLCPIENSFLGMWFPCMRNAVIKQ